MMKFLVQKIDNKVVHDFSFTLLESIRFQNWLQNEKAISVKYINSGENIWFKPFHRNYVPVGSVEFVSAWFDNFGYPVPKPINVPSELMDVYFSKRTIVNGDNGELGKRKGIWFVKSNDKIKYFSQLLHLNNEADIPPIGNYQLSKYIDIKSEWRAFIYQGKLVGLQNYGGDYTKFPNIESILKMIYAYTSAPVAYTLDVGVNDENTFVIECHDFFSIGLYGFANHNIYPFMLYRWFREYLNKK